MNASKGPRVDQDADRQYDLEERTACFGESVLDFCKTLERDVVTQPLIRQLVRSATSIGANYCEADDAASRKEFRYRIGVCRKEARETKYWLRMIARVAPGRAEDVRRLWQEAKELHLIFAAIVRKTKPDAGGSSASTA